MSREVRSFWPAAAALLLAAALFLACGVKAPPLPARQLLPERLSPPAYAFSEDGTLVVTFSPPTKNIRGLPLEDLGGFFVDRSENRLRPGFCPGCPVQYTKRIEIPAAPPPPGRRVAAVTYRFEDTLRPGFVYHYRLFAHDSHGEYDPTRSRTLVVNYDSPLRPPDEIKTMVEDNLVFLKWPPPDRLVDGRPAEDLAGYDIYRRVPDESWVKLNPGEPWGRPEFEDTLAVSGRVYEYKVRAVRLWRGTRIDGPPSPVVAANPLDLTPPPPPVKLFAASTPAGVKLTWTRVEAADLAGYRLYRRRADQSLFERVGPDLITDNMFVDPDVRKDETYHYRVSSVDNSPAANEGEVSLPASVLYEP
ncbi:MAG: fibronectin type III domain-containing protein [Thermodesulfobacteriota bacterium]